MAGCRPPIARLTGEDFGPREGDGISQVVSAQKQWQEWWREKGRK